MQTMSTRIGGKDQTPNRALEGNVKTGSTRMTRMDPRLASPCSPHANSASQQISQPTRPANPASQPGQPARPVSPASQPGQPARTADSASQLGQPARPASRPASLASPASRHGQRARHGLAGQCGGGRGGVSGAEEGQGGRARGGNKGVVGLAAWRQPGTFFFLKLFSHGFLQISHGFRWISCTWICTF